MKNIYKILLSSTLLLLFSGCQPSDDIRLADPEEELAFQVKYKVSKTIYNSEPSVVTVKSRSSSWNALPDGEIQLSRKLLLEVELENGERMEVGFGFSKVEANTDLLILEDHDKTWGEKRWDYLSFEEEVSRFYKDYDQGMIRVGGFVEFISSESNVFKILNVEKALVGGKEKTYLSAYFGGEFSSVYYYGENRPFYEIINGGFKGVIE